MAYGLRWATAAVVAFVSWTSGSPVQAQLLRSNIPTAAELATLGFQQHVQRHGGKDRLFLALEPSRQGPPPIAIVLLLHGGTQSMRKLFNQNAGATKEWPAVARANNLLLLVPNGTNAETGDAQGDNQLWNDLRGGKGVRTTTVDDVGFVLGMLDWATARYPAASKRVYVTGASNGGMMTYRLLVEAPHRFTAAAAFVASLPADTERIAKPKRATPLMIMAGTDDPLVKWEGGEILGKRGTVMPAAANLAWWLQANQAGPAPAETTLLPDTDPNDTCRLQRQTYSARPGGAPVVFYTMQGGGHSMPSRKHSVPDNFVVRRLIGTICRDAEAADLVWEFFRSHPRAQ